MYAKAYIGVECKLTRRLCVTYQELLIWGQFLPIGAGCGFYTADAVNQAHGAKPWHLAPVMLCIIALQVIYLIAVAALRKAEPEDERGRLIALKAYKVAYLTVMVLFALWVGASVLGMPAAHLFTSGPIVVTFVWFAVEALRTGIQLGLYRQSVRP